MVSSFQGDRHVSKGNVETLSCEPMPHVRFFAWVQQGQVGLENKISSLSRIQSQIISRKRTLCETLRVRMQRQRSLTF